MSTQPAIAPASAKPHQSRPATLIVVAIVLLVAMFAATSVPGWDLLLFVMVSVAWVLFGLIWLILFLTTLTDDSDDLSNRQVLAWLVVPLIAVLGAAVVRLDAPLVMRFELSRGAMERVVADGPGSLLPIDATRWVGLYEVDVFEDGRVTWFLVPEGGFMSDVGFAFSAAGEPADTGGRCRSLGGPWWVCATGVD